VSDLSSLYSRRFSDVDAESQDAVWREIARFLQRYVPADGQVLDIACDRGTFIRNIVARDKWAVDLRDVRRHLPPEIHFLQADGLKLTDVLPNGAFDLIFMSNYLEHLASSDDVVRQLEVVRQLLSPTGRVLILQPNIRLVGAAYWDFLDHHTALTEKSLVEAAENAGLATVELITRFLPYTSKSRVPRHPKLVRAYLAFPPAWRLMGRQTLYLGRRA
jgi:2-polyprenyl-3-methyl-5-hydroxy-6-metoxy-1,4-benzoquinol methylase